MKDEIIKQWKTKDGRLIPVTEMSDEHLVHAAAWLERQIEAARGMEMTRALNVYIQRFNMLRDEAKRRVSENAYQPQGYRGHEYRWVQGKEHGADWYSLEDAIEDAQTECELTKPVLIERAYTGDEGASLEGITYVWNQWNKLVPEHCYDLQVVIEDDPE